MKVLFLCLAAAVLPLAGPRSAAAAEPWPFPWPESRIAHYTAHRVAGPITVDGRLDEADWKAAPRSPRFSDLVRGAPGIHDTRAAVLWDDAHLYVGYWIEEPFVEGTLTERDSLIYKDNDAELFIAGRSPSTAASTRRTGRPPRGPPASPTSSGAPRASMTRGPPSCGTTATSTSATGSRSRSSRAR